MIFEKHNDSLGNEIKSGDFLIGTHQSNGINYPILYFCYELYVKKTSFCEETKIRTVTGLDRRLRTVRSTSEPATALRKEKASCGERMSPGTKKSFTLGIKGVLFLVLQVTPNKAKLFVPFMPSIIGKNEYLSIEKAK